MADPVECPECAKAMDHLRIEPPGRPAVELDACPSCGGLWFDRGELARASPQPPAGVVSGTKSALTCPRCRVELFDELLGPAETPAQTCFRCKGVWASGQAVDAAIPLHPTAARTPNETRAKSWLARWFG